MPDRFLQNRIRKDGRITKKERREYVMNEERTVNDNRMKKQSAIKNNHGVAAVKSARLAKMAMLVAISIVLVALIHFPIFPVVSFLEYDPADIPILVGAFAFGPAAGVVLTVVTSLIQGLTVSASTGGLYGIIMHILATSTLVLAAAGIYSREKTKKRALLGLGCGVAAMAVVMVIANLIITPLFMGVTVEAVWSLMPFIILFNVLKAGINGAVTFLVYKRISAFLHR